MDKYICKVCATIYDPERGDPENGVPKGTAFQDLPDNWTCTVCGSSKENFVILSSDQYKKYIPRI